MEELQALDHLTECLSNKANPQFETKMVEYGINQAALSRQQVNDYA